MDVVFREPTVSFLLHGAFVSVYSPDTVVYVHNQCVRWLWSDSFTENFPEIWCMHSQCVPGSPFPPRKRAWVQGYSRSSAATVLLGVMPSLGLISASASCIYVNNPACSTTDWSCVCNNTVWALLNFPCLYTQVINLLCIATCICHCPAAAVLRLNKKNYLQQV